MLALYIGSALVRAQTRDRARFEGWRGFGGTVVLTLSLTSALLLTCMLVLGVRALLTPPIDRSTVEGNWRLFDAGEVTEATDAVVLPDELIVPPVYGAFGLAVLVILAIVLLVGLAAAVAGLSRFVLLSTPTIAFPADAGVRRRVFDAVRLPAAAYTGRPARIAAPADARDRQVLTARRFAALAHRAEPLVGVLAAASITAITGIVLLGILRADLILAPPGSAALMSTVLVVMVAIATAAVGVVVANAASSKERPIGVLWDLLCFLPRAGHPFAPPCYGERVVPEIGTHTLEWLRGPEGRRTPNRKVVLSAHSMGGVLATAAMFAIVNNTGIDDHAPIPARGRVGLVTYGVQLRPYFSRFFPDVLGPDVLGVRPTRAPALFGADPWLEQVRSDAAGTPPEADDFLPHYGPGLREVLSGGEGEPPAWVSLWRRTDHLGFPIFGYRDSSSDDGAGNPVDRGATESDPRSYLWEVATHGNYQFTLQYRAGLRAVIDRLR
ncbi:hypothetical protein [Microbacterium sp. NIBRBAC000506063]|uniref:hypothetical protein n=1 Tax=Microbacterium sp. NIBRBAC000506063 TaxID=2734618 RepID=UPI001BB6003D|nr:hypothetical protein [Microbacterium sp. NIBRBAC000506063]QTV80174.1 hypothetical protein KAE78_03720 [Microbacterium sp. NIBRBAC000506063]